MILWYVCFSMLLCCLNIFALKKIEFKKINLYIITSGILNLIFVLTNAFFKELHISSFFDVFSINMLMYLSLWDIKESEMPSIAFAIYAFIGVIASLFNGFIITIIFTLVVFGVLFLIQKKFKSGMGMGDVYAISCISFFSTTSETMSIVMLSLLLSLVYGVVYSLLKKMSSKTVMIRFIPFLFIMSYLIKIFY